MTDIETLFNRVDTARTYADATRAVIALADTLAETETDEFIWDRVGEFGDFTLGDLIIGAYWHYTEWHSGQASIEYAALSALGGIFSPGMMAGPEPDTGQMAVYEWLEELANAEIAA